jgi:hypothetical protein
LREPRFLHAPRRHARWWPRYQSARGAY